jgi:hypothetical protein
MKRVVVWVCCFLIPALCLAQGRKDFRDGGIKSTTVYKYEYKSGK